MKVYYHKNEIEHNDKVKKWNKFFAKNSDKLEKDLDKADVILCAGGDGTLVKTVKTFAEKNKIILGINAGNIGFLLNNIANGEILFDKNLQVEEIELNMIKVQFNGKEYQAFNEVAIGNDMLSWINFNITENKVIIPDFKGSGIIVSTPQGSTGINKSCSGAVLPLESNSWSIVGDKTNRNINHITHPEKIELDVSARHSISVWIDGEKFKLNKNDSKIKVSKGNSVKLAFLSVNEFLTKRRSDF